jgi:hypothetical protein
MVHVWVPTPIFFELYFFSRHCALAGDADYTIIVKAVLLPWGLESVFMHYPAFSYSFIVVIFIGSFLRYLVWWQWHLISGMRRLLRKGSINTSQKVIIVFCSIWDFEFISRDWLSSILQTLRAWSKCCGHAQSSYQRGNDSKETNIYDRPKNATKPIGLSPTNERYWNDQECVLVISHGIHQGAI